MKKKLLIVALATAMVLLTGIIVGFAVDAANKNAEAQAAEKAAANKNAEAQAAEKAAANKSAEAQAAEKAAAKAAEKQANIDKTMQELGVSSDSEAGQVLLEVLQKKEMTETEMQAYLNASEEMKKMNHAQVMAKLEEYKDIEETLKTVPWEEAMKDETFMQRTAEMLAYRDYAQSIATGEALYKQKYIALSDIAENGPRMCQMNIDSWKEYLEANKDNPAAVTNALEMIFASEQKIKIGEFAGEMLAMFEQNKANGADIDQLNQDMQDIIDYVGDQCKIYSGLDSSEEWSAPDIATRYLAGESIEDIVG